MIPLFTTEQIRNADNYAIEQLKIPGIVLMENAALSVFNSIKQNFNLIEGISQIGIIAGKGNNGGDAFAVARHFVNVGFLVNVLFVGLEKELKGDALINFTIFKELTQKVNNGNLFFYKTKSDLNKIKNSTVLIDGLLGTGTKGEIKEPYKSIINFANGINAFRVANDLPSGLNLETSTGFPIFNADLTVTLAEFKTGLFYGNGYEFSGKIEKGSIGIGNEYFENQIVENYLIEPEDALIGLPKKKKTLHKYSNGKVLAIAGSGKYIGAASLLVRSLFQIGTGSVLLAFPKPIRNLISTNIGEAVFASYNDDGKEYFTTNSILDIKKQLDWCDLIAIGSGLGREKETIIAVSEIITKYNNKKMVIDADAIFAIAEIGVSKFNLKNKILTPHHAEFSHLLGISVEELNKNILHYGKKFAQTTKSILVLKGAPTIIFLPNGESLINSAGNVGMAKFGSGDVLTGIISGLVANTSDIEKAVISAVYLHSLSADLLLEKETEFGITATKIGENITNAISFLRNSII
jgi:NAD(P)H-hydrate epimerase